MSKEYPAIIPGGSLPLAWQLKDRRVVLIGGGEVAAGRLSNILQADALVTLIAPSSNLHPEVHYRLFSDPFSSSRITYIDRVYKDKEDLNGADMILTAIDDHEASLRIWKDAKEMKIPINVADVPPNCDFYFGSLIRRGPLQILVSTNGKGPKLANLIRRRVEHALPNEVELAIEKTGLLRERLRERAQGVGGKIGRERMRWMSGVCEKWTLEELAELDEAGMETLLDEGWEKRKVLGYRQVYGNTIVKKNNLSGPTVPWWGVSGAHWFGRGLVLGVLATWIVLRRSKAA